MFLEKTLESYLDNRNIKPVNPQGNQSWIFIGRTDAETEAPVLWPRDAKSWLTGKVPDAGKDWGQEEKGVTEDEMLGWHQTQWTWVWVNSESWWWTGRPGVQQSMGCKESDMTEKLNWTGQYVYTMKKAECRRIDAFELWCWRRLLRVPWISRSNWSILKEINPEYSLEGLMLKLQYFGHLMTWC